MSRNSLWQIRIDTGGTFTDCIGRDPSGTLHRCKVLSTGALRGRVVDQPGEHLIRVEQEWTAPEGFINGFNFRLPRSDHEQPSRVAHFDSERSTIRLESAADPSIIGKTFEVVSGQEAPVLGARLLTGTLPEEALPPIELRLATTRGTNALLERKGASTLLLVTEGFADLLRIGNQQRPDLFSLRVVKSGPFCTQIVEIPERIDSHGKVIRRPDTDIISELLDPIIDKVESVAICLMNSYINDEHERLLAELLQEKGVRELSISSRLSRSIKIIPRARTTEVNAYLAPTMQHYLDNIRRQTGLDRFSVMTSTGALTTAENYMPKDGLLSGPAGGVTGAAVIGEACSCDRLIAFDMGGTSTDVSRYDGKFEYRRDQMVGDARLSTPAISIETVAAGGGSICGFDGKSLTVGPESAGANPGPACYGSGGPLTITDINLLSGRLDPSNFHLPVDLSAARQAFQGLHAEIQSSGKEIPESRLLEGFLDIANEKMAQAIARVSTAKGFHPADYTLISYGGAGGQHATAVASRLNIRRILLPPDSGLLSAFGLDHARFSKIESLQCFASAGALEPELPVLFQKLIVRSKKALAEEGVDPEEAEVLSRSLFVRFKGQESTLELPWNPDLVLEDEFNREYFNSFGHRIAGREIEIESIRVITAAPRTVPPFSRRAAHSRNAIPSDRREIIWGDVTHQMPLYRRTDLMPGCRISGPALVLDPWTTLFLEPGWRAEVRSDCTIDMRRDPHEPVRNQTEKEPHEREEAIQLQLYTNRFSSIAEQMGEMLRRTSLSVNVKERLDFSCALLDRDGYLVVNAPHIPVHLGAMGLCTRTVLQEMTPHEGDVILTNHPGFGGSHLPDITLITPLFHKGKRVAFLANRAHHAEIGGKTPGSMPPDAKNLSEEGVVLPPFKLFSRGAENWSEIRKRLLAGPWPSRAVEENLADLQAAVAANHHGGKLLLKLIDRYGTAEVTRYMERLKSYAAGRMRQTLSRLEDGTFRAEERMDDGSRLTVRCSVEGERMEIDFSGTSGIHPGNLNANPAIVNSVVIYFLRLLIREPLPLNDGLLEPVTIRLPEGMLNPTFTDHPQDCPAVVGGNIETSQRLIDTLIKAFELAACSQGTMNNILFGNSRFGYYETVGGGTGAGEGFDGTDAVHHHMTNTRATDPEILEQRYPVRLNRFAIRKGSGGDGQWKGGDGLIRSLTFLEPVELSLLTQHRVVPPYGLKGGAPGMTGRQSIIRANGERITLNWKDAVRLEPGDRLELETPGGGGYGRTSAP